MRISTRTLSGVLNSHNKETVQWGYHGLIAYGANHIVAVVDSNTMQHVCSLYSHRCAVTKVHWAPAPVLSDVSDDGIFLATADSSGFIVLHDVSKGVVKQKLSEAHKVVHALELFYIGTELFLLALYQPALLVLWSPLSGEVVWKKSFTEPLHNFTRNPFDQRHIVFQGSSFVQLVKNFSSTHAPSDGARFNMSLTGGSSTGNDEKRSVKTSSVQKREKLSLSESKGNKLSEDVPSSNHIQVFYHQTLRNCIVLVYPQDIMILDLDIKQTIGVVSLERSTCPLLQVYPCHSRDVLYCLHDNGTIVLRTRKSDADLKQENTSPRLLEVAYEAQCSSDGVRITKQQRVYGFSVCPTSETKAAVIISDGKLLLWELQQSKEQVSEMSSSPSDHLNICLSDFFYSSLRGLMTRGEMKYNFLLTGVTTSLPTAPFVVRMCPPLTTKNYHVYQPLLAVGSMTGVIQVVNLLSGQIQRDFSIHSCQVRGIEWASLHSLVSHACESSPAGTSKSELAFTNIRTGKVSWFRQSKPDEGVIKSVKISYMKQYMVIVFKNKPMELWELKTLTMLREMSLDFPTITSLEWSPAPFKKKLGDDKNHIEGMKSYMAREHFVFTDNTSLLHHYIVEGSMIKDGSKIVVEGVTGMVTAMAWRHELLVLGDSAGNISFWDLKAKKSKDFPVHKGMVRKIRFAPGKDNTLILFLFNEEVQIWDKEKIELVSNLKFSKEIGRVNDADWMASDRVALSIADGFITITDLSLHKFTSPFCDLSIKGGTFYLNDSKSRWKERYAICNCLETEESKLSSITSLSDEVFKYIQNHSNIVERCLVAAYHFGDRFAIDFWTVCLLYLKQSHSKENAVTQCNTENVEHDLLESSFDVVCDSVSFKASELARVNMHDNKRFGGEIRLKSAARYILLGETDRAVHLLLESEADGQTFYSDSLRACLLATARLSGSSQSTIKLVATNLIANGRLSEGIELLCLIDKGLDACRYLQTYGEWYEATWLAKVALNSQESREILSRWINEHLCSPSENEKTKAVLAAVSIGDYMKAVELLYSMQCYSMAALFIESCIESNSLEKNSKNLPVMEAVFLQYARVLKNVGMVNAAKHYSQQSGEQGTQLLEELRQLEASEELRQLEASEI